MTIATPAAVASAASATAVAVPAFNAGRSWRIFQSNGTMVTVSVTQEGSGWLFESALSSPSQQAGWFTTRTF
ncbi:hypothetical protein ACGFJC_49560 [Nonomuraea fuscirosea]|uniref:hypothetical protein n=1 Tax=Nonomuraea fuscirosea TaxID=1291556 RepID=UPI0037162C75